MATRKAVKKKASGKKAAPEKAAQKKAVSKKAVSKKAVSKKAPARKKAAPKSPAKNKKQHRPKLGFDPLNPADIDALTAPGERGEEPEMEELHPGIDSLIRDTTAGQATGLSYDNRALGAMDEVSPESATAADALSIEAPRSASESPLSDIDKDRAIEEESSQEKKPVKAAPRKDALKSGGEDNERDISTFFSFWLGQESFAVSILRVKEVLEYQSPTKVPRTQEHMIGVINLRGSVVPVVDLRKLFGMPEAERTVHSSIIILEVDTEDGQITIGALVDAVREVIDIREEEIAPPPRIGSGLSTEYIMGMGKHDDEFLIILDVDRVFSVEGLLEEQTD